MADVAAIVVNYCGLQDTLDCLESLSKSDYSGHIHPIVIDNASPDGSGRALAKQLGAGADVILLEDNVGFGAANNLAAKVAFELGYELLLIINSDTVVHPDMVAALVNELSECDAVSPLMLYYDKPDVIWYAGGSFDCWHSPTHLHMGEMLGQLDLKRCDVQFLTGCCILVRTSLFVETGGFDEAYFLYWEDADLSMRLVRDGRRLVFEPEAVLWHKVSSSTGGEGSPASYYYGSRNRLYASHKLHLGPMPRIRAIMGLFRALLTKEPRYSLVGHAWSDYLHGRMGELRKPH